MPWFVLMRFFGLYVCLCFLVCLAAEVGLGLALQHHGILQFAYAAMTAVGCIDLLLESVVRSLPGCAAQCACGVLYATTS